MTDIWTRAWLRNQGGSLGASATLGTGAQSPVLHQSDPIQKMNSGNIDRESKDRGIGGSGGGVGRSGGPYNQPGPTGSVRGTRGTPSRTGGSKNVIPV